MNSILNYPHLGILFAAWFIADLGIPLLIRLGHKLQVLDRPGGHKAQSAPIPFFGGLGIFISFSAAICIVLRIESVEQFQPLIGMLFGGAVVVTLGLVDDHKPINATIKLAALFGITLLLSFFGVNLSLFPNILWDLPNTIVTLFWIVGATSAMNSIDNTDGVAPGLTVIAATFIFYIAWGSSATDAQPWLSYIAVGIIGSCLGLLRYNFPPARIYLGDNGSFFLGYMLAVMLVFAQYSTNPLKAILIPGMILSVPIFDIVLCTILRYRDKDVHSFKEAVLYCGRDHVAHLLMGLGLSKTQAVLTLYSLAICGGIVGLLIRAANTNATCLILAGTYLTFLSAFAVILGRARPFVLARQKHEDEYKLALEHMAQSPERQKEAVSSSSNIDWEQIEKIKSLGSEQSQKTKASQIRD